MGLELIYGVMVGSSLLLLIILFIFGIGQHGDVQVGHNVEFGHGHIEMGHGNVDVGHGHIEVGHGHDGIHIGDTSDFSGPSAISFRLILAYILGFGVGGFLGAHYSWWLPHWTWGIISGFVFYFLVYQILKLLYKQQANTQVSFDTLVGAKAVITEQFDVGAVGEAKAMDPQTGQIVYFRVRSTRSFKKGETAIVKDVEAGLAYIE